MLVVFLSGCLDFSVVLVSSLCVFRTSQETDWEHCLCQVCQVGW